MIRVRLAEQSDREKWDAYVNSHPDASPYHIFAWGLAVKQAYGHKVYYFLAENDQAVVGLLPAVQFRIPFFLNELVALPYCDVGGCLCDGQEALEAILAEFMSLGRKIKANKIQLRGHIEFSPAQQFNWLLERRNKVRMLLDLPESSEVLMKSFKSKLRSQVKKAEKNDLVFQWGGDRDLAEYYAVLCENMHALGSPVHSRELFKAVLQHFQEKAKIGLVYLRKKPIAAGLILMNGKMVSVPWASTLRTYNRLSPNMLLYWNFLKYSADNGYNIFDFGRSSKGEGTYKFKAQWGAQSIPLDWYSLQLRDRPPPNNNQAEITGRDFFAGIWQKIPLRLANYLGPRLRKYISL